MVDHGLVSIVMPNYNCAHFLKESVGSVLRQTYKNWELIFVDDCSSDNSIDVINRVAANDRRIKIFKNNKNEGAAYSRNFALTQAKGKWVAFLDSDDIWNEIKLEKQLEFMVEQGYHFSYTNYAVIGDGGSSLNLLYSGPSVVTKNMLYKCCYMGCLTVMYDRSLVGDVKIADFIKKRNDYALWLKIIKVTKKCYLLNECLGLYRKRQNSISRNKRYKLVKYHYIVFRKSEGKNCLSSVYYSFMNIIFFFYKRIFYVKKIGR